MAKTIALNDLETVWVTVYSRGAGRGTMFDISMQLDGETQLTASFTVDELKTLLMNKPGQIKGLATPEFVNKRRPLTPREEAERVCDRIDAEDNQIPPHTHSLLGWSCAGITSVGGGPDHQHCHAYTPGDSFTEEVYGHKHPVGTSTMTGEYFVGFSVPV